MTATQAPTPGPLSGDDELIERGLRTIRTYDAVRSLRDALSATTARLTGYDWNADPDSITKQQGDAFAAADKVFSDLDAAVAAHPEIDLPQCEACNGTGKIEEPARMEGANQHSACVRSCDECDGCGFGPEPSLAPTAPVEASGSEREDDPIDAQEIDGRHDVDPDVEDIEWPESPLANDLYRHIQSQFCLHDDEAAEEAGAVLSIMAKHGIDPNKLPLNLRPQPSGETRDAVARLEAELAHPCRVGSKCSVDADDLRALLSARPLALGGQQGEIVAYRQWCVSDKPHQGGWWQLIEKHDGDHAIATGGGKNLRPLYDTTPARAEAQDEGAAGEASAYRVRMISNDPAEWVLMHPEKALDFLSRKGWESQPLYAHPSPTPAADADAVREATGAKAVIRDEQIIISIDVDALPGILSGSIATNSVAGLFKVTDPAEFAKEVCRALNAEKEDGTTRVHMMFDSAFNHAIDHGAEGVEEVTEDEFEAEAQRIQSEALAALKSTAAKEGGEA